MAARERRWPRTSERVVALALAAAVCLGCGRKQPDGARQTGPVEVGVVTVEERPVPLSTELPGRTSAYRVAEVRARASGIVLKRLFTEGSDVEEGDLLFEIDPAPYEATLLSAKATLARANATHANARIQARRAERLFKGGVGTEQEWENAEATANVARADVVAAEAAVKTAEINVGYTKVVAPISGRIGKAEVTEGAYAQTQPATLLATIHQNDPMYVDVTWSTAEVLRLKDDLESGRLESTNEPEVKVHLPDGRAYAQAGKLQFADVTVDPTTASITLRAIFPNPGGDLLPGMFVRARIQEGVRPNALLVPQRAVTRDAKGEATALVVNAEDKVERRPVVTDRAVGAAWIVTDGLRSGDRVIVEGSQKVRPDAQVVAVPSEADVDVDADLDAPG